MPSYELDILLEQANGDMNYLEAALGYDTGFFSDNIIMRVDVTSPVSVRMPSGNEAGANSNWIPGGILPTGFTEGVIDVTTTTEYVAKFRFEHFY